jgi:hypothetical protein
MNVTPFSVIGLLLATGPGILLLAVLAASIVLLWDWRWALPGAVIVSLGLSSIQAALHSPDLLVTISQWLAVIVAGVLLGLAGRFHPAAARVHANSNWVTRLIALLFVVGAWWVIDPGVNLPLFTQVETDLIIWTGLCGLLLVSLSAAPLHTGIGLLLLLAPLQATAAILLPGAGLAIVASIAQILVGLGCAYLTLAQQLPSRTQRLMAPLPAATPQALPTPPRPARGFPSLRRQAPAAVAPGAGSETGREAHTPVEKSL